MPLVIYYSTKSEGTKRLVEKLGYSNLRIPLHLSEPDLIVNKPFVLITPTYGGGSTKGAVPKQVIKFLNIPANREHLKGVVAGGNTNFYTAYGIAGDIIANKCKVPLLYKFEILGTQEDVAMIKERILTVMPTDTGEKR